jgi:hypothetical protein
MAWAGARAGLGLGAITCLLVALLGLLALRGIAPFARADPEEITPLLNEQLGI